jgi:hypothetical protein
VSNPGLVIEDDHAHGSDDLVGEEGRLVGGRGGRQHAGRDPAVDRRAVLDAIDEVLSSERAFFDRSPIEYMMMPQLTEQ